MKTCRPGHPKTPVHSGHRSHRFALALVLAVGNAALGAAAHAEWSELESFDDGMLVFVDAASARRSAETGQFAQFAQLAHLVRWPEPQRENGLPAYRSTIVVTAYDCLGKSERYLGSTSYAGVMGSGAKVFADNQEASNWYPISDSSMEEKLWKIACAAN